MKKQLIIGLMGSFLLFTGCGSNEENEATNPSEPQILLSKITTAYYTNPANSAAGVVKLNYNNQRQLIKIVSENVVSILEYDVAGKPSKITYQKPDGTVTYYKTCTYSGDRLTMVKTIYPNSNYDTTITYNNDRVATTSTCESPNCTNPSTYSYEYTGNNILAETSINDGIGGPHTIKKEYSYDNKVNPYSLTNTYFRIFIGGPQFLGQNNYTTEKISTKDNGGNWTPIKNITYEIQYNQDQLPIRVVGKDANGNNYVEYNYEYITQ